MKLTILGTSAAYPGPGQACSGFLIEEENTRLLVDCGTGVLSNLQKVLDLRDVSDILITHMHADHFIDLVPYRYALRYGFNGSNGPRPRLHLPPQGNDALGQVISSFSESDSFFADVFDISEYEPTKTLKLGDLSLHFAAVLHYVPTYSVAIAGAKKIVYSSDSGMCPELLQVAKGADLFICNVGGCLREDKNFWGHLTPDGAGKVAAEAGVKRLVLAHFWPACNRNLNLEEAAKAFGGPVELAESVRTYLL